MCCFSLNWVGCLLFFLEEVLICSKCREADESRLREVCESLLGPPIGMEEVKPPDMKPLWDPFILVSPLLLYLAIAGCVVFVPTKHVHVCMSDWYVSMWTFAWESLCSYACQHVHDFATFLIHRMFYCNIC